MFIFIITIEKTDSKLSFHYFLVLKHIFLLTECTTRNDRYNNKYLNSCICILECKMKGCQAVDTAFFGCHVWSKVGVQLPSNQTQLAKVQDKSELGTFLPQKRNHWRENEKNYRYLVSTATIRPN